MPIPRSARPPILVALALLAPLAVAIGAAHAGDLKARVAGLESLHPSAYASIAAADRHAWTMREFDPLVSQKYTTVGADPAKDVTIAIYGAGGKEFFERARVTIRLAGARANPATVVIPPGVPVSFRNDDPFLHHLVSIGANTVDRDLRPLESHTIEPVGKGVYQFGDTLAPSVRVWVVVEDGVIADAHPAHDGSLRIPEMAPAEYTLKAFFEGNARATIANIKIPATGSIDVKEPFQLAPPASSGSK